MKLYTLDKDKNPIRCFDVLEWSDFVLKNQIIEKTKIADKEISTVFVGTDVILFETAVFQSGEMIESKKLKSYKEAVDSHWDMQRKINLEIAEIEN